IKGEDVFINGDGETSRDFCFVENAVQANLLSALALDEARNQVYNVAVNERTSLNQLFEYLRKALMECGVCCNQPPTYLEFRSGDVRHSQADISKADELLGYEPQYSLLGGLKQAMPWYVRFLNS